MPKRETLNPETFPYFDYRHLTYSLGIATGDILWLCGHTASRQDPATGQMICQGDVVEQMRVAYEKMGLILEAAGASFEDVVYTVDYVAPEGLEGYRATADVRREYFGSSFPASTGIIVNRLLRPDALIEVEAVAVRGPATKLAFNPGWERYHRLTFMPAVQKGDLLFLSGMTASDPETGTVVGTGDLAAQTRFIYENMGRVLESAGATPADVVRTIDYITPQGLENYRETGEVRREFFGDSFPASTGIIVERLLRPEALVEIAAIAVQGGSKESYNPGWPRYERLTYHPGVRKGNLLLLSGFTGSDPVSRTVAEGDVVAQARQTYLNVKSVLESAGASMKDVVKAVNYITPDALDRYQDAAAVRRELFGDDLPVSTAVVVNRLLRPELLIEIDVTAVVG